MMHGRDGIHLICNGYYPEIHIIHPLTLEVLLSLSSRIQPGWISALCIIRPLKRESKSENQCQHNVFIILLLLQAWGDFLIPFYFIVHYNL